MSLQSRSQPRKEHRTLAVLEAGTCLPSLSTIVSPDAVLGKERLHTPGRAFFYFAQTRHLGRRIGSASEQSEKQDDGVD